MPYLAGKIESESRQRGMRKSVADLTAYDFLLKSNDYVNDWHASEGDTALAEMIYTRAVELEPDLAGAYVGLARVHVHRNLYGFADSPEEAGERES